MPTTTEDVHGTGKRWASNAVKVGLYQFNCLASVLQWTAGRDGGGGGKMKPKVYCQGVQGNGRYKVPIKGHRE